ncbi:MAG TPA: nucleotide sugar dehydrogenase [Kineosporiaceae bacterium]|nr:nucleotide sugar dehydrogenase [Kineosporiaceae bacterium]
MKQTHELADSLGNRRFDLSIVGLGYVGLALAQAACEIGWRVAGYEIDDARVDLLLAGRSYIDDVSHDDVARMRAAGFVAGDDPAYLRDSAVIVICVPTPVSGDRQPNLSSVVAAAETIADQLTPGTLVVLESTTFPGTTEEVLLPILERGGLRVGVDFHLAFAPERVDPGNKAFPMRSVARVVGGVTPACTAAAARFYGCLVDRVVSARGTREAEMSKLIENTYRQVNIALANELSTFSRELGVDLWDAVACASSKPYGFHAFFPGPGVGGHCIPVDPHYLTYKVRTIGSTFRMAELAHEINSQMPDYVVRRAAALLNRRKLAVNGSSILLLGVSYKPDVSDLRGTPAYPIAEGLRKLGADVQFHDANVDYWEVDGKEVQPVTDLAAALVSHDLVILLQRHAEYTDALLSSCTTLFDSCGSARDQALEVL